jgi:hypothetical protein
MQVERPVDWKHDRVIVVHGGRSCCR